VPIDEDKGFEESRGTLFVISVVADAVIENPCATTFSFRLALPVLWWSLGRKSWGCGGWPVKELERAKAGNKRPEPTSFSVEKAIFLIATRNYESAGMRRLHK
jgi:hypothetical protein